MEFCSRIILYAKTPDVNLGRPDSVAILATIAEQTRNMKMMNVAAGSAIQNWYPNTDAEEFGEPSAGATIFGELVAAFCIGSIKTELIMGPCDREVL